MTERPLTAERLQALLVRAALVCGLLVGFAVGYFVAVDIHACAAETTIAEGPCGS